MGHETLWFPQNTRKAATPSHGAPGTRAELERGGAPGAGLGGLNTSVAAGVGARRRGGLGCQACSRSAAQIDCATRPALAATMAARGQDVWLSQRAMDLEAHGHGDLAGVPSALSPLARVEGLAELALELSSTGTPGHPARRARNRALEALPVAGHKKKPENLAPISRSSTRAAFCSSLRVVGLGRLKDRRQSSSTATSLTASRRWPPSRCPRSASTWGCLSASNRPTSSAMHVASFLQGLLRHLRGHIILLGDQGSIHRGPAIAAIQRAYPRLHIEEFPAHAPNSILSSSSGTTSKATSRTACRATRRTSAALCRPTPVASGAPRQNCARSSYF